MAKFGLLLVFFVITISAAAVFAHSEKNFTETKTLVDSNIPCSNLSEDKLELIGEYYMEQMHPGEAHEILDRALGGEGSESLRQAHISIARHIYCGQMMGMGRGMMGYGNFNSRSYGIITRISVWKRNLFRKVGSGVYAEHGLKL